MAGHQHPRIGRRYARKFMSEKAKARFIEPMLLLRTEQLPDGPEWHHELKFDGYRALAIKNGGKVSSGPANDNDFNGRYPAIVKALSATPDETVIDGEVVALDGDGKPAFNLLQNYAAGADLRFFIFDVLVLKGKDVMGEPLVRRRELLEKHVFPKMLEPIRYSPVLEASLKDLIQSVKAQGLVAGTSRACVPAPGKKCASIGGRNSSLRVTRHHPRISTRWSSAITTAATLYVLRARGMGSRRHPGLSYSKRLGLWKSRNPVREPAGEKGRALGGRTDGSKDDGMPVA
jgi:hypothetical protein